MVVRTPTRLDLADMAGPEEYLAKVGVFWRLKLTTMKLLIYTEEHNTDSHAHIILKMRVLFLTLYIKF